MTTSCNNHLSSATMHNHFLCCRWFILYKHQWNTRWAFARKLDIFTCENTMLSLHVKISPLLYWLHNKSRPSHQKLLKWNGLIFHWCLYNKQNITWPLGDTKINFSSCVEKIFHHSKRNFISLCGHVTLISSIHYINTNETEYIWLIQ